MASPLLLVLASAVVLGGVSTLLVVVAVSIDSWQDVTFDEAAIQRINKSANVMIVSLSKVTQFFKVTVTSSSSVNASSELYIIHSSFNGLWKTCDHLSDDDRNTYYDYLQQTVTSAECYVFVTDYNENNPYLTTDSKQIARLHNSAASCYIVVIIDLCSAVVVGLVGILRKQVTSCMVTGVLYFMAALFGVFGLAMFHTKHYYQTYECASFDKLPEVLCDARQVSMLYAIPLAWVGIIFCLLATALWLVFARALRVIMAKTML